MLFVRVTPRPYCLVADLVRRGFFFQGELADRWAGGWLDWRSCMCRN